MDWSKIKTIFILTFLILDVYLLYQFMKIRDANKYEFITEASFEDKLKADEIKYIELPKTTIKDQYVSAKQVGSQPCRSVSQGVAVCNCLPKTAWPPTCL